MPLPDLKPLADAGGWTVAVAILLTVIGLLIRGDLVTKAVSDANKSRGDSADKSMGELVPLVREIASDGKVRDVQMTFLVDFVKETLRERARGGG